MAIARASQVHLASTRYYHCISRCVRRAFLCGQDPLSGKNFDHRKSWLEHRLAIVSNAFSIRICAYSIMSNHYHVVLFVDLEQATQWTDKEVARRWSMLFKDPLARKFAAGHKLSLVERTIRKIRIPLWRQRLMDISWFMRCVNESIAKRANAEDECTGRFWEGRFKSKALLDEGAVLTCMVYVDLNPIRAGQAISLEKSHYTSVQTRILAQNSKLKKKPVLMNFTEPGKPYTEHDDPRLNFSLQDYILLVNWTGRAILQHKPSTIPAQLHTLLHRVNVRQDRWHATVNQLEARFYRAVGSIQHLRLLAKVFKRHWMQGLRSAVQMYAQAN